jgi:hypothetical protein
MIIQRPACTHYCAMQVGGAAAWGGGGGRRCSGEISLQRRALGGTVGRENEPVGRGIARAKPSDNSSADGANCQDPQSQRQAWRVGAGKDESRVTSHCCLEATWMRQCRLFRSGLLFQPGPALHKEGHLRGPRGREGGKATHVWGLRRKHTACSR